MLRLSFLAFAALAASVAAEPWPYMKRENRNELPLLVETRGCPIDTATVRAMAEGVLTRAQIKPLEGIEERVEVAVTDYVKANSEPNLTPETPRRSNRAR
jgi:hypothetical protein